ncbi:MAG: TolC family protein, partial [Clostridium sp.]|nr:TolC family protein [Clostridium sp.]
MQKTGIKAGNGFKLLLAAALTVSLTAVCGEARAEETAAVTVEYENLKELLKAGNVSLKQQYADSDANIADYAEIVAIMDWERSNLEDKAEEAEEAGTENAALYASNASMLKSSAKSISKQIDRLTGSKAVRTLEKSADTYTMAAQTVMNSYNQMAGNLLAREKSVEALTASYNETVRRQSVGSATQADVSAARDSMEEAVNSLESLREQAGELRRQLLSMLGLTDAENVVIGEIPEPDLAAIEAINFEADQVKAVGNSSQVQEARHSSAVGTAAVNRKLKAADTAEGEAMAEILETYQTLTAKATAYRAALASWE